MAFISEEQRQSYWELVQKAIEMAMQGKWREAVAINQAMLKEFSPDADTYNRLGRALMELGEYEEAIGAYQQALKLDPHNRIAQKNLARLEKLTDKPGTKEHKIVPHPFLEEAGKSGIVELINLANVEVLSRMSAGEEVELKREDGRLIIADKNGLYLGEVEPKHAQRLLKLMEGGNQYSAAIAEVNEGVKVFIQEIYQHPSQAGRLSFPPKKMDYRPYLKDSLLRREEEETFPGYYLGEEILTED